MLYLLFGSFKKESAKCHFVRLKLHDFSNEVFFGLIDDFMEFTFFLSFERHSKLKLFIIHES